MKRLAGVYWLSLLLVAGCATTPGSAQTNGSDDPVVTAAVPSEPEPASDDLTIWDGVYTTAQAERGLETAEASCFACHSENEWENPMMLRVWSGQPIHGMWENIRMTMPYDAPGRLTPQEYSDIVAYMLELNDVPAGETELPGDVDALREIQITPPE